MRNIHANLCKLAGGLPAECFFPGQGGKAGSNALDSEREIIPVGGLPHGLVVGDELPHVEVMKALVEGYRLSECLSTLPRFSLP